MTSKPVGIPYEEVRRRLLANPEFRAEWERTAPARALALRLVAYRAEHGLSQTALAKKLGVSQPAVFRMELGEHLPTLATLIKIAEALDIEVLVDITPKGRPSAWLLPEAARDAAAERTATANGGTLLLAVGAPSRSAAD
ncbi:MAG: helix-turn-helix transcriptional regulator [Chloroflexia bacterium]|nr:helix-turn-helix transcriptional regulator [Chloroflexia bacterium]